ncbi:MAG: hypothetical protein RL215_2696 [Planctomycetota bacterium]|jgi:hypothetical protein
MKTAGLMRVVCGTAVVLWTSVGFADDLTNLLRLVQAVAQERSGTARSDRSSRERGGFEQFSEPSRTTRESSKRSQERDYPQGREFERSPVEGRWRSEPERSSRMPSRGRLPAPAERSDGSTRFPSGHVDPERSWGTSDWNGGFGSGPNRRLPSGMRYEERRSVELSLSFGEGGFRPGYGAPRVVPVPIPQPLHHVGEIVCCRVPLATMVRVRGADNICRHAVPAVVAVRDPNSCSHDAFERVVYVQVMVPPCPPRKIEVSPCHTRIELCFEDYDVEIISRDGVISVEYDD